MKGKIGATVATLAALTFGGTASAGDCCVQHGSTRTHTTYEARTHCETYYVPRTTTVTPRRLNVRLPFLLDDAVNCLSRAGEELFRALRVPSKDSCRFSLPLPPKVRTYSSCASEYSCDPCDPCESNYRKHTIAPEEIPAPTPAPELSPGPAI